MQRNDETVALASNKERSDQIASDIFTMFNRNRIDPANGIIGLLKCLDSAMEMVIVDPPTQPEREMNKRQMLELVEGLRKNVEEVATDDATCVPQKQELDRQRHMATVMNRIEEKAKRKGKDEVFH